MKEIRSFLISICLFSLMLFFFLGCEDKKVEEPFTTIEDTTEVFTQIDKDQQKEKTVVQDIKAEEINTTSEHNITNEENTTLKESIDEVITPETMMGDNYTLSDIKQIKHTLSIDGQKITLHTIDSPIVILNFFTTSCTPCRGQIPYLSDLQEKYKKKIFIAGILIKDTVDEHTLIQFMSTYHANYFISNHTENDTFAHKIVKNIQLSENFTLPLTVIYKEGHYYTHYEGAVPIEMIDHDIKKALKEQKER